MNYTNSPLELYDFLNSKNLRTLASVDKKHRQSEKEAQSAKCGHKKCKFRICIGGNWIVYGLERTPPESLQDLTVCSVGLPNDRVRSEERLSCLVRCEDRVKPNAYFTNVLKSVRQIVLQLLRQGNHELKSNGGSLHFIQDLSLADMETHPDVDYSSEPDRTVLTASNEGAELTELTVSRNAKAVSLLKIAHNKQRAVAHTLESMLPSRLYGLCIYAQEDSPISIITKMSIEFRLEEK